MKTINPIKTMFLIATALLLTLTLVSGAQATHGGGGGSGSSGGGTSTKATAAKSSFSQVVKNIAQIMEKSQQGGAQGQSVELATPGSAVTSAPGQAPSKDVGVSIMDKARLDKVRVNKTAPIPSKL